jgi:hypothetical protein
MSINAQMQKLGLTPDGNYGITIQGDLKVDGTLTNLVGKGKIFYVSSVSGSANYAGITPATPLATIDAAIGKCIASRGDVIVILPSHAEDIASAVSLVCDIAGVTIIGLGKGTMRPKLTFTAAAGSIVVSAANVTFQNIIFEAAFADVADAFTPSAVNLTLKDCDFQDSAADKNFIELVDTGTTDNQCDGLTFTGCSWISPDLLTTSMINLDADCNKITIENCYVNLGVNTSDLPICIDVATGKDVTNLKILNNYFIRLNDANPLLVTANTTTANTGIIKSNCIVHRDTASELLVTAATLIGFFENKATAVADFSGYTLPASDS